MNCSYLKEGPSDYSKVYWGTLFKESTPSLSVQMQLIRGRRDSMGSLDSLQSLLNSPPSMLHARIRQNFGLEESHPWINPPPTIWQEWHALHLIHGRVCRRPGNVAVQICGMVDSATYHRPHRWGWRDVPTSRRHESLPTTRQISIHPPQPSCTSHILLQAQSSSTFLSLLLITQIPVVKVWVKSYDEPHFVKLWNLWFKKKVVGMRWGIPWFQARLLWLTQTMTLGALLALALLAGDNLHPVSPVVVYAIMSNIQERADLSAPMDLSLHLIQQLNNDKASILLPWMIIPPGQDPSSLPAGQVEVSPGDCSLWGWWWLGVELWRMFLTLRSYVWVLYTYSTVYTYLLLSHTTLGCSATVLNSTGLVVSQLNGTKATVCFS